MSVLPKKSRLPCENRTRRVQGCFSQIICGAAGVRLQICATLQDFTIVTLHNLMLHRGVSFVIGGNASQSSRFRVAIRTGEN